MIPARETRAGAFFYFLRTLTTAAVEITFDSEADMEKIIEMGFKEGFSTAHTNLDELLAK